MGGMADRAAPQASKSIEEMLQHETIKELLDEIEEKLAGEAPDASGLALSSLLPPPPLRFFFSGTGGGRGDLCHYCHH